MKRATRNHHRNNVVSYGFKTLRDDIEDEELMRMVEITEQLIEDKKQ